LFRLLFTLFSISLRKVLLFEIVKPKVNLRVLLLQECHSCKESIVLVPVIAQFFLSLNQHFGLFLESFFIGLDDFF